MHMYYIHQIVNNKIFMFSHIFVMEGDIGKWKEVNITLSRLIKEVYENLGVCQNTKDEVIS